MRNATLLVLGLSFGPLAIGSAVAGCGGDKKPPAAPVHEDEPEDDGPSGPRMQMKSELGQIDQAETEKTFQSLGPDLQKCFTDGLKRVEYLSGDIKIYIRVAEDGAAKIVTLEDSTLGDQTTQDCIVGALQAAKWPQPEGGEAEVRHGMGFDAPGDVRAPTSWESDKITETLAKAAEPIGECRKGIRGNFRGFMYVVPKGDHGKVRAVGMLPPQPGAKGEEATKCLVEALSELEFPSPGSYAAKVAFQL